MWTERECTDEPDKALSLSLTSARTNTLVGCTDNNNNNNKNTAQLLRDNKENKPTGQTEQKEEKWERKRE